MGRKTPEEWLQLANAESGLTGSPVHGLDEDAAPSLTTKGHGRLKIYLGYAAGVGKTCKMLEEANRRRDRGQDVVVGYIETHGRAGTVQQVGPLEVVPRARVEHRGVTLEEMNLEAILKRRPQVCLVDELAHSNVPGSLHAKRWQDVNVMLGAGISVLSTLNVQHLESLNDAVFDITGVLVRETVPDTVLREADEVVIVDVTPRALINRLQRGDVYRKEKVEQALGNFFREGNLSALRELALREVAHSVDEDVTNYRKSKNIESHWASTERVMLCLSPSSSSLRIIRRGWRLAQRLQADLVAVYVADHPPTVQEKAVLASDFVLAEKLGIPVVTLEGTVATEITRYALENQVTQLVIGHSSRAWWQELLRGSIINRLTRALRHVDILIVTEPRPGEAARGRRVRPARVPTGTEHSLDNSPH